MITDTEIKRTIKAVTAETILSAESAGRGGGSLKLRIRPGANGNTATWIAAWKSDGKRSFKPLGRYPEMTLAQARELFRAEVAPALLSGKDPRVAVVAEGKPTVARMFAAYVESMRDKGRASAGEVERMLLLAEYNAADAIGRNKLAGSVDPADVAEYASRFFREGNRGAADKARSYVSAAFNWAMKSTFDYTARSRHDWGIKSNPATAVKRDSGSIKNRDRNLSPGEMQALWAAARGDRAGFGIETAACLKLILCCGQRVQETLRIEGHEIDLQAGVWSMPAPKTKGKKRAHDVPLPPQAIAILADLKAIHGNGWLFPARPGSKLPHIDHRSVQQVIDRWNVGIMPKFQTRDLRRTWKSRTGEIGISKEIRDIIQQHTRRDIGSKAYDRADYLPAMRVAMGVWSEWLSKNVTRSETSIGIHAVDA